MSENAIEVFDKSTLSKVQKRVAEMRDDGEIDFPPNYSPQNALKAAWLELQRTTDKNDNPVLQSCSKSSVMQAMLEMAIEGLNPAKDQGYFIPYGNKLVWQRSYFGDLALSKRVEAVDDIYPVIIWKEDEVEIKVTKGQEYVAKHETSFESRNSGIKGAYAVIKWSSDRPDYYEIMTKDELEKAWSQSKFGGSGSMQDFTQEKAKRTVIRRASKRVINSSDDAYLLSGQDISREEAHEKQVEEEISQEAHSEVVDIEDESDQKESLEAAEEASGEMEETEDDKDSGEAEDSEDSDDELFDMPEGQTPPDF